MAKCKYYFSKDELERYYNEYESFSLAGKKLGISKGTFRQQYLKSQGLCMICMAEIPDGHTSYTCEECLERSRVEDKPSTKLCSTCKVTTLNKASGQSKVSWTKKQDCEECLEEKNKVSFKKTYLKYRVRNLAKSKLDPRVKEYQDWYRTTPEGKAKRKASGSRRRALKVSTASPTIDKYIENLILTKDQYECPYCESKDDLSIDHILPLSRGGTHTEDNVELVCLPCNIRKGTKTKEEYIDFLKEFNN